MTTRPERPRLAPVVAAVAKATHVTTSLKFASTNPTGKVLVGLTNQLLILMHGGIFLHSDKMWVILIGR